MKAHPPRLPGILWMALGMVGWLCNAVLQKRDLADARTPEHMHERMHAQTHSCIQADQGKGLGALGKL